MVTAPFDLYDFLRGPAFLLTTAVFALGTVWRISQLLRLTRRKAAPRRPAWMTAASDRGFLFGRQAKPAPAAIFLRMRLRLRRTILGSNPVMGAVSLVFHILLFLSPLLLPAHNILAWQATGVSIFTLPETVVDAFTVVLMAIGGFFLVRRIVIPRVRALTTAVDYVTLLVVLAPLATAFLAYHQYFDYRTMLFAHMITGEAALMALPFSKLGHMPFLLFSRFFVAGEYAITRGKRAWRGVSPRSNRRPA